MRPSYYHLGTMGAFPRPILDIPWGPLVTRTSDQSLSRESGGRGPVFHRPSRESMLTSPSMFRLSQDLRLALYLGPVCPIKTTIETQVPFPGGSGKHAHSTNDGPGTQENPTESICQTTKVPEAMWSRTSTTTGIPRPSRRPPDI